MYSSVLLRACSSPQRPLRTCLPRTSSSGVLCRCLVRRSLFHHPLLLHLHLNCHRQNFSLFRCRDHHLVGLVVPDQNRIGEHSLAAPLSSLCQVGPPLHHHHHSPHICNRLLLLNHFEPEPFMPFSSFHLCPGN